MNTQIYTLKFHVHKDINEVYSSNAQDHMGYRRNIR